MVQQKQAEQSVGGGGEDKEIDNNIDEAASENKKQKEVVNLDSDGEPRKKRNRNRQRENKRQYKYKQLQLEATGMPKQEVHIAKKVEKAKKPGVRVEIFVDRDNLTEEEVVRKAKMIEMIKKKTEKDAKMSKKKKKVKTVEDKITKEKLVDV